MSLPQFFSIRALLAITVTLFFSMPSAFAQNWVNVDGCAVNVIQTNPSCFGKNDGSIAAFPSGGQAPYTYAWSSGGTSAIKSNLPAGSYTLTVTDAAGCQVVASAALTQPAQINGSIVAADATCFGAANGSIDVTVSGGAGASPTSGIQEIRLRI